MSPRRQARQERTSLAATISGTADFINRYGYDNLSRFNQITQQEQSGGNAVQAKSIYVGYDNAGDITQLDYSNTTSPGPQQNGPGYACAPAAQTGARTITRYPTNTLITPGTGNGSIPDLSGVTFQKAGTNNHFPGARDP